MKKLRSIHVTPGTAGANYLDTTLALHGAEDGYSSSVTVTAGELACAAFLTLAGWLLAQAAQGEWTLGSAILEPAGNIVVDDKTNRDVFALALTLRRDEGERTVDYSSERIDTAARDALPELWAAAQREFSTEKTTKPNTQE